MANKLSYTIEEVDALLGAVEDMQAQVFPLTASYGTKNNGTYEVGTSVTPTVALNITRKGADVASSATVTVSPSDATVASNNESWTAPALSSGSKSYSTSVTQGGQTVNLGSLSWSFTYYRYRGALSSVPSDYAAAIKALATKELSVSTSLGSTALAANKYYLFAVKGTNVTFTVKHAQTGGTISGCETGTATIEQENGAGSNVYSYVLVPASSSAWNFTIN